MASACYQKSGGRMTCLFCHKPHKPTSEVALGFYNGRCLECHATQPCTRPLDAGEAAASGDCVSCHMPKQKLADVRHAAATDHWIRRPNHSLDHETTGPVEEGLTSFWPDDDPGQLGSAYVKWFGAWGARDKIERGISLLEQALEKSPGTTEWRYYLGQGYAHLEQWAQARDQMQAVPPDDRNGVEARRVLAEALYQLGQQPEAIRCVEETLSRWPWHADSDHLLATLYWKAGLADRIVRMERDFFQYHPDSIPRLELVARALDRLGRPPAQVNEVLERAARLDRSIASPYLLMANLAARRSDTEQVESALHRALRAEPDSSSVRIAWAGYLASQGRRREAAAELQSLLTRDPRNTAARQLLQQMGR